MFCIIVFYRMTQKKNSIRNWESGKRTVECNGYFLVDLSVLCLSLFENLWWGDGGDDGDDQQLIDLLSMSLVLVL